MASLATDTPAATPAPADPPGPYRIQAIERAVAILGVFTADEPDLRVSDIAQRLGLHKSTVHRFLVNLEAAGMVEKSARTGRYRLGLRLFELGSLVMQRMNLWDEALPFLEGLVHGTGETGHLAVLEAGEAVYVERVEARRALRVPSAIGRGYPAHATNLGKVLLAHRPAAEVDEIIDALARKLAAANPGAVRELKRIFFEGTDHWETLLYERAAISGSLILTPAAREALAALARG